MNKNNSRRQYNRWARSKEGQEIRISILRHQLYLCYHCRALIDVGDMELDHLIPLDKGGTNDTSNLYASCKSCNRQKGAKHNPTPIYWWLEERMNYTNGEG